MMQIYDCFTFFNEIELLKLRLELLNEYVDKFVIVELDKTFRGEKKPLFFKENEDKYNEYKDKIIYLTPSDIPDYSGDGDWGIEIYQRNCILRGLTNCNSEDIIMISDVDELPNFEFLDKLKTNCEFSLVIPRNRGKRSKVKLLANIVSELGLWAGMKKIMNKNTNKNILDKTWITCEQSLFYYFLNCRSKGKWYGTVISEYKKLTTPQELRDQRNNLLAVENGGWHFSYLGGIERVKSKLSSIIDNNKEIIDVMNRYVSDDRYIEDCLNNGIDLYGRKGDEFAYSFIKLSEIGIPNIDKIFKDIPSFFRLK